jgi:hypothetical protein
MEIDPKDVRIDHFYLGPGKESSLKVVHLPIGVSVAETVPADSTEPGRTITDRLLLALKLRIRAKGSSEKS